MPNITATKDEYEEMLSDLSILESLLMDIGERLYLKFGAPRCGGLMVGLTACIEAQGVLQHRMDNEFPAEGDIRANERAEAKRLTKETIAKKKAMMAERKERSNLKKQIEDVAAIEPNPEVAAVLNDKLRKKRTIFDLLPPEQRPKEYQ
ncbi:hypothetical protein [Methanosarcina sp.]|uniref:hypothetical protein n=1 Tax=Methanosarcina sp. TaxID=2213 RepID=UPI002BBBE8A2|nr:hypothetical protein [Methanosarcina sp.]HOW13491.1 hypothetical protein [Methanosarcina sp.]